MKLERRSQRVTTGNAQDLYFRCVSNWPSPAGAPDHGGPAAAAAALHEVHQDRGRTTVEALNHYLAGPQVLARLSRQLQGSWADVRAGTEITGPFFAGLTTVLGPADGHREGVARQRVWTALIADAAPVQPRCAGPDGPAAATALVGGRPGLVAPFAAAPPVSGETGGDQPLDRSVVERVRATLRRPGP